MLITKKEELSRFYSSHRMWQGVPGIERTRGGRTFVTFYSGGVSEQEGNFAVVLKSDNDTDFGEPVAAAFKEGIFRCFDSTLWIDPLGRLWFIWSVAPGEEVFAAICKDPDADTLVWERELYIGRGVMLNKPTVLSSGEWLFPIALWNFNIRPWQRLKYIKVGEVARSNVYKSVDLGKTFTLLGGSELVGRNFDEHSVVELSDGSLMMTVRCDYGTGKCYSYDRGKSWTRGENAGFGAAVTRIHIRKLRSGRILRISHEGAGRTNLTAYLSEDDGKTYPYKLLLDDRKSVSYPDATEADDGYIYIVYDRERGNNMGSLEKSYACAREILTAKVSEDDIIRGEISGGGFLRNVVSKLGALADGEADPYLLHRGSARDVANSVLSAEGDAIDYLFAIHPVNCESYYGDDGKTIDSLIDEFRRGGSNDADILTRIISIIRKYPRVSRDAAPLIESVKNYVEENYIRDISVSDLSAALGVSAYYMSFRFKDRTGTSISEYIKAKRLNAAKLMLINTDKTVAKISKECGFLSADAFSEIFISGEGISPKEYRRFNGK
ncbi:MAG: helix-turn-helix domain-containing protein [Clostridia bacterium]|nr:helix-turn-helix domain-containing protein [Clostridia bacterium]